MNLFEAGTYPRHRVCGEYLSGRGPELLGSLVSPEKLLASGARRSLDLRMYRGADSLPSRPLPQPALCLSRHRLDALLAREFSSHGGQLHLQSRRPAEKAEGRVLATGRRPAVQEQGWRWIGIKAHAWDVSIDSGLEMHLTPHGYVGSQAQFRKAVQIGILSDSQFTPMPLPDDPATLNIPMLATERFKPPTSWWRRTAS